MIGHSDTVRCWGPCQVLSPFPIRFEFPFQCSLWGAVALFPKLGAASQLHCTVVRKPPSPCPAEALPSWRTQCQSAGTQKRDIEKYKLISTVFYPHASSRTARTPRWTWGGRQGEEWARKSSKGEESCLPQMEEAQRAFCTP